MKISGFISALFIITISANIFSQSIDFLITADGSKKPISPYIYGTNQLLTEEEKKRNKRLKDEIDELKKGFNSENNNCNQNIDEIARSNFNKINESYLLFLKITSDL